MVGELEVTAVNVHDSRVDVSTLGEVVYRDKGYRGVESRGWDATMRRGQGSSVGHIRDELRNRRISRKRCPGEKGCLR